MNSVYPINKALGRPVVFRGLVAQYIWRMAMALVVCLLLFALLYIAGLGIVFCTCFVFVAAGISIWKVYRLNQQYGQHGMMKKMAAQAIPKWIKA
ncbi:DUF4133 domain-containing protein [Sediminibacterium sp.]|uniref:DUF4133 domain-containing protein n=1 Tax=Sediminibacterium sp. TaxID=1917865 RepID=UPI003F69C4BB